MRFRHRVMAGIITAVVFAGCTVVVALLSLFVAGIPLVAALGYTAAVAVGTAVLAVVSLIIGQAVNGAHWAIGVSFGFATLALGLLVYGLLWLLSRRDRDGARSRTDAAGGRLPGSCHGISVGIPAKQRITAR